MAGRFSIGGWRGALLLVSLCLNVLLLAFVGTHFYRHIKTPLLGGSPARPIEMLARRLPQADREILRRAHDSREAPLAIAQTEYLNALAVAVRRLSEPEVDRASFRAAVQDARDKRMRVGDLMLETFVEALPEMSAEGRRKLSMRLRQRP